MYYPCSENKDADQQLPACACCWFSYAADQIIHVINDKTIKSVLSTCKAPLFNIDTNEEEDEEEEEE